jgi:hypothetical protein
MPKEDSAIKKVAQILGIEKAAWSRVCQCRKQALKDGFTDEDFVEAAKNMAKADKQYQSIYSVFLKTDYWLSKSEPEAPKGVW